MEWLIKKGTSQFSYDAEIKYNHSNQQASFVGNLEH